jgi:hypothetical protein
MWYSKDIRCIVETRNRNIVIYSYIGIVFIQFYVFVFSLNREGGGGPRICSTKLIRDIRFYPVYINTE